MVLVAYLSATDAYEPSFSNPMTQESSNHAALLGHLSHSGSPGPPQPQTSSLFPERTWEHWLALVPRLPESSSFVTYSHSQSFVALSCPAKRQTSWPCCSRNGVGDHWRSGPLEGQIWASPPPPSPPNPRPRASTTSCSHHCPCLQVKEEQHANTQQSEDPLLQHLHHVAQHLRPKQRRLKNWPRMARVFEPAGLNCPFPRIHPLVSSLPAPAPSAAQRSTLVRVGLRVGELHLRQGLGDRFFLGSFVGTHQTKKLPLLRQYCHSKVTRLFGGFQKHAMNQGGNHLCH